MDFLQEILIRLNEMDRQYNCHSPKGWFSMTDAEIILGAEYPEMWGWVGLDKDKFMKSKVYQYPEGND